MTDDFNEVVNMTHTLTYAELKNLMTITEDKINSRRTAERNEVVTKVKELIAASGFSLDDICEGLLSECSFHVTHELISGGNGENKPKRKLTPALPAKFRNPQNPDQSWSGRGKRPGWFVTALASGVDKETLRVTA